MNFIIDLIEINAELSYQIIFSILSIGFVVFWLSLIAWVWSDSRVYFESVTFRTFFCVVVMLFGFIGLFIYLLFRYSKISRDSWSQNDLDLMGLNVRACPDCNDLNLSNSLFCKNCGFLLIGKCKGCKKSVHIEDVYCSNCGLILKDGKKRLAKDDIVEKNRQLRYIIRVFKKTWLSLKKTLMLKRKTLKSKIKIIKDNRKGKKHKSSKKS